jgi:hypothetical protein
VNLRLRRRRPDQEQPTVHLVTYSRSGKLRRRTVTLAPPAPPPPYVIAAGSFARLDWAMEEYLADLRSKQAQREQARRQAGEEAA